LSDLILDVLNVVTMVVQLLALAITLYYFTVGIFGWIPKKEKGEPSTRKNTFALLVAAHNEEVVIANMVDSLVALDYDKDSYDVFVIADNCTDNTAQVAREHGAIVYERFDTTKRGKGFALEWMFEKLFNMEKQYDYIGIFDADTATVSKTTRTYLSEKEKNGVLTTATDEVPRAFVLYGDKENENICFSLLSAKTLVKRNEAETEK
jgi:cellulose synthase/poly-beta-1,6-N-acetylglucosamine synthase-like glycosyltransferase